MEEVFQGEGEVFSPSPIDDVAAPSPQEAPPFPFTPRTPQAQDALQDRYLLPGESPDGMLRRVCDAYAANTAHHRRLLTSLRRRWWLPATPVLANGGTTRGLPISCFLSHVPDSMRGIADNWYENVWLASKGGGLGVYYGDVRSIGEGVGQVGRTSGIMPFLKVLDSQTLAISQGMLRRANAAIYLPIHHPEVEEFIEMRRPTGGDVNRRCLNLHHGVCIPDSFMRAVEAGGDWELISPRDERVIRSLPARDLWIRLLTARLETGEPYLLFTDAVARGRSPVQQRLGLTITSSNLCSEITLPIGPDHLGRERTAVCCLASLNAETWDEWRGEVDQLVEDILLFLDAVLEDFITRAPPEAHRAVYSASRERSLGLGVMGWHAYLQAHGLPFESALASSWNRRLMGPVVAAAVKANAHIANLLGPCPDAQDVGLGLRWSNCLAIAPTASISILAETSPSIEPWTANIFQHKTLGGSSLVRNRHLEAALAEAGSNTEGTWQAIQAAGGSIQDLPLPDRIKEVFRTAFELDQRWILSHAADRTPLVCQSQSINLFLPADIHKADLHRLHMAAWKGGLKSLYYCRSTAIQRSGAGQLKPQLNAGQQAIDSDTCMACQ